MPSVQFLDNLQEEVAAAARQAKLVGAAIALSVQGRLCMAHYGVANVETGTPMTAQTVHQIGSISKVFTAILIMQLVEEGAINLSDPVSALLPELRLSGRAVSRKITVQHLLTHTSGLELGDWQGEKLWHTGRGDDCLEKYIQYCSDHLLLTPPAAKFPADAARYHYSNIGYVLLGRIIERCTGQIWDGRLGQKIFAPLGLQSATSLPEQAVRFPNAIGHIVNAKGDAPRAVDAPYLARAMGPAVGRIKMTAGDMICFARNFLGSSTAGILSPKSLKTMRKAFVSVSEEQGQGLGWMLYDWSGVPVFGHDGGVPGQIATLRLLPDQDIIAAGFFNGGNAVAFVADFFPRLFHTLGGIIYPKVPAAAVAHFATYMMQGNYDFPGKDVDIVNGKRVARNVAAAGKA